MKLLRTFPKVAFEFGLASWHWLELREQTPRFATCFGDIFLESLDGWWFLDTVEGTLELRWHSAVTMYAELESPAGRATYLMDDLVRDARGRGIHLSEEDVYTFNPHPALGGELGVNGLGTMRFELALNWVGQVHDQVQHNSGSITLPTSPPGGHRPAAPVTDAWDAAWSEDETFSAPFEQYLATGTLAAVAGPRAGDERPVEHHAAQAYPAQPYPASAQGYAAQDYPAQGYPAQPFPAGSFPPPPLQTEPFGSSPFPPQHFEPQPHQSQPFEAEPFQPQSWSGQNEVASTWQDPNQAAQQPFTGYGAPAAGQQAAPPWHGAPDAALSGGPYEQQPWAPHEPAPGQYEQYTPDPGQARPDQPLGQADAQQAWPDPAWGTQSPPDDPFTAWDDLWGKP